MGSNEATTRRAVDDTSLRITSPRPTRVMLVDDHEVVRHGLRRLLESNGLTIVAEAGTEAEAITEAARHSPDVVVMDVRLGTGGSGIDATRHIRKQLPRVNVLMLTSFRDDDTLVASMAAGASGFLLKELRTDEILRAVEAVARGENLFEKLDAETSIDRVRKGKHLTSAKLARLSPQEERVLERLALGETNGEIGRALDLAEKTVKNYISNVLLKLGVRRRAEAAAYWARHTAPSG